MSQNIINIEIEDHRIYISGAISLKLVVSNEFEYIGNQEILIYDKAKVFHYVFAKSTKNKYQDPLISKLLVLQYEYYLPEVMQSYNYTSTDTIKLGGILWQRDNFIDRTTYDDWDSKSDVYQMITFLEKKKFKHPDWVWNNRLVTMLNKEKNQELLILYIEQIPKDKMKKLFSNGDIIDHQWQKEKVDLKKRSLLAFSIL